MLNYQQIHHNYQYAYQVPTCTAILKQNPSDFVVKEQLPFEPDGEGNHAFLWIEKISLNTQDVIQQLAKFTGLDARHIGYAGLKDKHAITSQWFSINLEGLTEPDWTTFSHSNIQIKSVCYHKKKLKTGSILANEFLITLRDIALTDITLKDLTLKDRTAHNLTEKETQDKVKQDIETRLQQIIQSGVPNYFGPQRFGTNNQNMNKADAWFAGKLKIKQHAQKSMILSAARSFLFNHLLSQRITEYGWNNLISGEVMMLDGSNSIFVVDNGDDGTDNSTYDSNIISRFEKNDIHPTLALWGQGEIISHANLAVLEKNLIEQYPQWCQALENKGLKQQRRTLRVLPQKLQFKWLEDNQLQLQFMLPKGCYATSLLRELVMN